MYYGDSPPTPPGVSLCQYGRLGIFGRAIRDGWLSVMKPLQIAAVPKAKGAERLALSVAGALAAVGFVVAIGVAWALTPWGRRCHWQNTFHPYTVTSEGCSLVSQHWHSITNLRCEVRDPNRNTVEFPIPFPARVSDSQKILVPPNERLDSFTLPLHGPGRYKFTWKADLDGCPRTVVIARARFQVKP